MTLSFFTDEHVPSVFITTLRSSGYAVVRANDEFGEGTNDQELLEYCANNEYIYITNDKKDFTRTFSEEVDHAGIIIYTDPLFLRDSPAEAVTLIDRVLEFYPPRELRNERIWLDQWHKD